ncbi:MAG: hypothetical protein WBC44_00185 [Planctomycetaceae bacterium]
MKRLLAVALFAALILPAAAQQRSSTDKANAEGTTTTDDASKPYLLDVSEARAKRGRVPNGYGKLGLTRDQKERIYGIQAAYAERVKELTAELEQLKDEQGLQIKDVLSDVQKTQIERYEAQMAARRSGGQ